ncbi:MAG: hypothetical protein AAFU49_09630 [Pseudomonadota bacterium]
MCSQIPHSDYVQPKRGGNDRPQHGGPQPKVIFDEPPNRKRYANTDLPHRRTICHLKMFLANGASFFGTGWFVSDDTVLTAGHNILTPDGKFTELVEVIPGRNQSVEPIGRTKSNRKNCHVLDGWKQTRKKRFDFGAIKLPTSLGAEADHFKPWIISDAELEEDWGFNTVGYPHSQSHFGSMWQDYGSLRKFDDHFLYHRFDTEAGQSGSPLYAREDGVRSAVGVHVYGTPGLHNFAVRLTAELEDKIGTWIGMPFRT